MRRLILTLLIPALAHADGAVVFTRAGSFWQKTDAGETSLFKVDGDVRWMEATRDGKLIVLDFGGRASWIVADDSERPMSLHGGPCIGRARPAPDANAVVCPTADGPALVATTQDVTLPIPGPLDDPAFLGAAGVDIIGLTSEGIVAIDRRKPADRRTLARPGATAGFLAAPDGIHAVAVFGERELGRVRSFMLDGQGVSRQLGGPGFPTVFSWDSQWVLFQEGDIKNAPKPGDEEGGVGRSYPFLVAASPQNNNRRKKKASASREATVTTRVCVARVTGGEVKCWDGYTGLAFSPDSTRVLLKRDKALYVGKIAGVRPDPPQRLVDNVDGAATWLPAPLSP